MSHNNRRFSPSPPDAPPITRETSRGPEKHLSEGGNWGSGRSYLPVRVSLGTDPGGDASKKSIQPSPAAVISEVRHCPFVNACWVHVKIRRVLHYDASACMKVYFKESVEEGRGLSSKGDRPEEGRLKGRLLYLEKSQLQNKTVLYLQRKNSLKFLFGSRERNL